MPKNNETFKVYEEVTTPNKNKTVNAKAPSPAISNNIEESVHEDIVEESPNSPQVPI